MATTRPFAYNTGTTIDGTIQIGNIAIGVSDQDYSQDPGGVKWWMGPDEELGYVIANQVPTGDHPTPVDEDSYINFWRSTDLTEQSLLDLLNVLPITDGLEPFTNGSDAKTWLNNNGYFTTYGEDLPTPTPTPTNLPTATPTPLPATSTPTPLPATATPTPTDNLGDSLLQENGDSLLQENGDNILLESTSTTPTPTPTPDVTSVPTDTPTPLPATSTPTPAPTDTPVPATSTPTPTPTPINHGFQYTLIDRTNTTGPFGTDLGLACEGVSCLESEDCTISGSFDVYFDNPNVSVGDYAYLGANSNVLASITDGYYILSDGEFNAPFIFEFVSNQVVALLTCVAPTATPTSTPTVTPTPGPTSTPTPTPEMASLFIDIVMGYDGISFGGVTYTSDTTISVVKNQQYSIVAFSGSGLFQNWEGTNVNLPVPNSSNTIVTITGDTATLKAVFPEMTPTPTPTVVPSTATPTPTPTETPLPATSTPTPTPTTVASCSGKPYILKNSLSTVNSGESLWVSNSNPPDASNLVNTLAAGNPLYFYKIDNNGTDQTSYFGNAVGTSFTITFCQDGNSAVYSGVTGAMIYDGGINSYEIDATKLSIVQRSTVSTFTFGEVFYVDILVAGQSTPTPTPTSTIEPTNVPTDTPTPTPEPATATPVPTGVPTDTPTPTPLAATSTPTPQPTSTATPLPATSTPTPTPLAATNTPTPEPTVQSTSTPTPTPTSGAGVGSWFFYSDEGAMNAGPPNANGNALFMIVTGSSTETYNPNKVSGLMLHFCVKDSAGTDYTSQFSGYTGGTGTITISQNGDTATYTSTTPGSFGIQNVGGGNSFFVINTASCTQTKTSNAPFVNGDPISITFGSGTPTPTPTPGGPTSTPTPTTAPTSTPTPTSAPTSTPTPLPATATPTPSATATETPTPAPPTATPTSTPIPSNIIVAAGGVNVLSYSYDGGDNWTNSSNGATFISQPAFAVATDGNMFVAGGTPAAFGGNGLLWSNDGDTWSGSTNGSTMFTTNVRGVAYGGDKWVAVGISSGAAKFAYSYDGITWTAASNSNAIGSVPNSVAYNGSRWVAVGSSPAGGSGNRTTIAYSDDGISWTASANSGTIFTGSSLNVAWGGDKWVAVGTGANRIAYSTDGITWSGSTSGNSRITGTGYGIAYNGSQWVAAGQGTNALAYSSDGITWSGATNSNTIFSFQSYCVTWTGTKWVAGGIGTNQLATSTDGDTWTVTTNGNTIMNNRVQGLAAKY
jgi:hypothetical protein